MIFPIEWHYHVSCTSWPCPKLSRSQIWDVNMSEMVRAIAKKSMNSYLPSNGIIANVVLHDLDLNFLSKKYWNVNISETVRAVAKVHHNIYRGWYLPSNDSIVKVVLLDLDLHFQDQTFSCYVFPQKNVQTANVPGRFTLTRTITNLTEFYDKSTTFVPTESMPASELHHKDREPRLQRNAGRARPLRQPADEDGKLGWTH